MDEGRVDGRAEGSRIVPSDSIFAGTGIVATVIGRVTAATVTRGCKGRTVVKKYLQVPELIVGFDTETTGLDVDREQAISYGFCEYQFGGPTRSEHFFVLPDRPITEGARRVHGLTREDIAAKRSTNAVYTVAEGLNRAVSMLLEYQERGAFIVGANLVRFDFAMMRSSYQLISEATRDAEPFDPSSLQTIDVIEHDLAMEPSRLSRPRRGLGSLCTHYGVEPGGHDALNDAHAAVNVFIEQVIANNKGQMILDLAARSKLHDETIAD